VGNLFLDFHAPLSGGLDLDSRKSGCARLGGEVGPPLGVVVEEVAVLVVLVRRHRLFFLLFCGADALCITLIFIFFRVPAIGMNIDRSASCVTPSTLEGRGVVERHLQWPHVYRGAVMVVV